MLEPQETWEKVAVLDIGSYSIKAGWVAAGVENPVDPKVVTPNLLAKVKGSEKKLYGDQVEDCGSYFVKSPHDRGLLVDWETQKDILTERVFSRSGLNINQTENHAIFITYAPYTPAALLREMREVLFEEMGFQRVGAFPSTWCAIWAFGNEDYGRNHYGRNPCSVIIDCGYHSCLSVPMWSTEPLHHQTKRLDIGGKLLSDKLMQSLAYTKVDLRECPHVVDAIKENMCIVSLNFEEEFKRAQKESKIYKKTFLDVTYNLPNFDTSQTTSIKKKTTQPTPVPVEEETYQQVTLSSERLAIPELLFRPPDANLPGFRECGITEMVQRCIYQCNESLRPFFASRLILVGGSSCTPNFKERLKMELVSCLPDDWTVNVTQQEKPQFSVWRGACALTNNEEFLMPTVSVSKAYWDDQGPTSNTDK
eukprot:GHVL01001300.1.p1 GENE.GHVL01001300.1~~GHVL01001300.1.p1  ORF type:complete len:422 (+),score=89.25 GHVL01001300.1:233-1498(+)